MKAEAFANAICYPWTEGYVTQFLVISKEADNENL